MKNIWPKQRPILFSALSGTLMMTMSSYLISWAKKQNFKEPVLLGIMLRRLFPSTSRQAGYHAGWAVHCFAGVLFAEAYAPLWKPNETVTNTKIGLVLGGLSGIAAILIWKFTMDVHPYPPRTNFSDFAGQLLIVHLVFGYFTALGYSWLTRRK